jgi:hypothetical protein
MRQVAGAEFRVVDAAGGRSIGVTRQRRRLYELERSSVSMIWLSGNRDFLIFVDRFHWKKSYFPALRILGG